MTFVHRRIDVTLDGSASGSGTVKLTGHRVHAVITSVGSPGYGAAEVAIYGLTLSEINKMSTYGQPFFAQKQFYLTVEAGDSKNGMSTVFKGYVVQAWGDFQAMPTVPFHIVANAAAAPIVQRSQDGSKDWNSYSGRTSVKTMYQTLAGQMGFTLEYNGPDYFLSSPYHFGSPARQFEQIREAVDHMAVYENGTIAVWPLNEFRSGGDLVVSRDTGMIAYPSFTNYGVLVRAEFSRLVPFGAKFTVQSDITMANKTWSLAKAEYRLEAEQPKGLWFVDLYGWDPSSGIPFPSQV